jgi:HTH-type transcriptional regulator/antitoxin HigA
MDNEQETIYQPRRVPHPGEVIADYLEDNGWSQRDLARRSGLTPKTISEICNGKAPITPPTSLAFEKVLQRPAHFWLNLQRQFDEAEARLLADKKAVEWTHWAERFPLTEWTKWARRFPLTEMKRYRWIERSEPKTNDVESLLSFLGVSSPESWEDVWRASHVSYRQTRNVRASIEAIAVWVRATELFAAELDVREFDERLLKESINELRRLTRKAVPDAIQAVQAICGAAGVAVVWVPELEHTGISGCARWLTNRKALIALTLRYKTDDQMWFTFFHELGHLLLHRKRLEFILDNAVETLTDKFVDPQMQKEEEEANRFASDTLIPPEKLATFLGEKNLRSEAVFKFSEDIGIGPGLIVGRLQHEGVLAPHQGNAFKQKLAWKTADEATDDEKNEE